MLAWFDDGLVGVNSGQRNPLADILKFTEKPNLRSKFLKQTMDYSYEVLMETFSREVFILPMQLRWL